jgi:hypothetical protein
VPPHSPPLGPGGLPSVLFSVTRCRLLAHSNHKDAMMCNRLRYTVRSACAAAHYLPKTGAGLYRDPASGLPTTSVLRNPQLLWFRRLTGWMCRLNTFLGHSNSCVAAPPLIREYHMTGPANLGPRSGATAGRSWRRRARRSQVTKVPSFSSCATDCGTPDARQRWASPSETRSDPGFVNASPKSGRVLLTFAVPFRRRVLPG